MSLSPTLFKFEISCLRFTNKSGTCTKVPGRLDGNYFIRCLICLIYLMLPYQKSLFQHHLVILLSPKKLSFSRNLWWFLPYPFRGLKWQKRVFYSIFVIGSDKIRILKFVFLAFFEAKMTKIYILNPKLIVPNDYQQIFPTNVTFLLIYLF